ncbi:MAG: hypothetical protein MJZ20_11510 [Bacteroidaceae bacterium]|nr:hypothetical protein [Bacteroidaceae bacterium]
MRTFKDENGDIWCEPNSVDEWVYNIWALGFDYDGMDTSVESMRELVDELVECAQKARELLYDGKLFSKTPMVGERPDDWKEVYE